MITTRTGEGTPVVFQHGLGANRNQVVSLLKDIPDVDLFTMDMPGHGENEVTDDQPVSFDFYADCLIRELMDSGIPNAIFGGISMGAGIAINVATRYPEFVNGLFLVRPAWLSSPDPVNLLTLLEVANLLDEPGGYEIFQQLPEMTALANELPGAFASIQGLFQRDQQEKTATILSQMVGDCPIRAESNITVPTLIIGNHHDPLHPWEMAKEWQQRISNSTLLEVPSRYIDNEGHRDRVRNALTTFINKLNEK